MISTIFLANGKFVKNVLVSMTAIYIFIIWLAPWASKMTQIAHCDWLPELARWSHLACAGLPAVSHKQNFPESHIINPLLTKFARSRWLDIGLVLFLRVSSQSINMQKKELGQYPAILTSRLVNNPYIYMSGAQRPLLDLAFCIYLQREILILSGNSQGIWKLFLFVATMMYSIKFANTVCVCLLLIFTLWFPL